MRDTSHSQWLGITAQNAEDQARYFLPGTRSSKSTRQEIDDSTAKKFTNKLFSNLEGDSDGTYNNVDRIYIVSHSPVDKHTDKYWNEHQTEFKRIESQIGGFQILMCCFLRKAGKNTVC